MPLLFETVKKAGYKVRLPLHKRGFGCFFDKLKRHWLFCQCLFSLEGYVFLHSLRSAAANLSAGDFGACVAGGLGGKIGASAVDDYGAADDILHTEAIREKDGEGVAAAAEKGWQVPGVLRVRAVVRIEMAPNIGKGVAAVAGAAGPGMDVKSENRVAAGPLRLRQAGNVGRHKHAPAGLIKAYHSADVRVLVAALYLGDGGWPLSDAYKLIQIAHKVTSEHCMSGRRI